MENELPRLEEERKDAPGGECFYCGWDTSEDSNLCPACALSMKRRRREYLARTAEAAAA